MTDTTEVADAIDSLRSLIAEATMKIVGKLDELVDSMEKVSHQLDK